MSEFEAMTEQFETMRRQADKNALRHVPLSALLRELAFRSACRVEQICDYCLQPYSTPPCSEPTRHIQDHVDFESFDLAAVAEHLVTVEEQPLGDTMFYACMIGGQVQIGPSSNEKEQTEEGARRVREAVAECLGDLLDKAGT